MPTPTITAFAMALGIIGFSVPVQQVANFTNEPSQDYFGNDIGMVEISPRDYQACRSICAANSQCLAFNVYTPAPYDKGYCWLKHTVGTPRHDPNSIGGVRLTATAARPAAPAPAPAPTTVQPSAPASAGQEVTLSNGKRVILPDSVSGCVRAARETTSLGNSVDFQCRTVLVRVFVVTSPTSARPSAELQAFATEWQPNFMSWPEADRSRVIERESKTLAGGVTANFSCLTYDNVATFEGLHVCYLDTPTVELAVSGEAPLAVDAVNAVNAVLSQVSYR